MWRQLEELERRMRRCMGREAPLLVLDPAFGRSQCCWSGLGTAGAEDCASEYAFDHLGAQSQISHTVNETIPKNPEVGDYILKRSCR